MATDFQIEQKCFQHQAKHFKQARVAWLYANETCFLDLEYFRRCQVMVDQNFRLIQQKDFLKPGMKHIKQLKQTIQGQMEEHEPL